MSGGDVIALDPVTSIDRVIERARRAGDALRRAGDERVVRAIASAASLLADPGSRVGREARQLLPARSGLSEQNVEHALRASLGALEEASLHAALDELARAHQGRTTAPVGLAGMVLAGNVFTASVRPLAWALLTRAPVILKPSSADEGLSELFAVALAEADPELGDAVALLRFARQDAAMLGAMASRCDVLHAWGSDRSVAEIRASLPASTSFVAHGHGLGAVWVPAAALSSPGDAERVAAGIALDVALYDQRGCLSPHFVLVERGARVPAIELARMLSEGGLAPLARTMPRGALPVHVGATQVQWRGVGAVRGELFEGDGWSVTCESDAPVRLSPGWRNVAVHEIAASDLASRLEPFGMHLKALGVAADRDARRALARTLPPPLAPRISAIGAMQTPPLLAATDALPPWTGYLLTRDVD